MSTDVLETARIFGDARVRFVALAKHGRRWAEITIHTPLSPGPIAAQYEARHFGNFDVSLKNAAHRGRVPIGTAEIRNANAVNGDRWVEVFISLPLSPDDALAAWQFEWMLKAIKERLAWLDVRLQMEQDSPSDRQLPERKPGFFRKALSR